MHSKMEIYAEILRQIGRMPNDYKEPDMDDMDEMEMPEVEQENEEVVLDKAANKAAPKK
jgi:hypothetical protein